MLLELDALDTESLNRLADERLLAVRIRRFVPRPLADDLGKQILGNGFATYANAPSIGRIGMAFYEAENQRAQMDDYFASVAHNLEELRRRCRPYLNPIDLVRCVLDEVWPAGARLQTLWGRKMYVGLSRVVKPGVRFLAHHDIFAKDAPGSAEAESVVTQLACNVYLTMPSQGGELQLWAKELAPDDFDALRGDSYGIEPDLLGPPSLTIRPEPGDLILFNSRRMHAVTPGNDQPRLSLSCFVGYRGAAEPLTYWS
ncbi:2OG-Fe(II) oxygenase [uncultured Pseudomonas sp.]|uniref:2OG-Fe(II) oxygenase family protein n=1 Tax=uncultured Pseudomonas sp. TaxID=114707 RepID=UPI0025F749B9|nr:2OG-Fe(II) oxygenase [uncultured Pseudomonas sp.]